MNIFARRYIPSGICISSWDTLNLNKKSFSASSWVHSAQHFLHPPLVSLDDLQEQTFHFSVEILRPFQNQHLKTYFSRLFDFWILFDLLHPLHHRLLTPIVYHYFLMEHTELVCHPHLLRFKYFPEGAAMLFWFVIDRWWVQRGGGQGYERIGFGTAMFGGCFLWKCGRVGMCGLADHVLWSMC